MNIPPASSKERLQQEFVILRGKYSQEELQTLGSMLLLTEQEESEVEAHMMGSSQLVYDAARLHYKDLRRQADEVRLANEIAKGGVPFWPRLIWGFGNFLVTIGRRMTSRPISGRIAHSTGD